MIGSDLGLIHAGLKGDLLGAFEAALQGSDFVGGATVERFEAAWADYCGVAHAVSTSSGTSALELALRALGIGEGHEVLVPTNTFFATVSAVVRTGATPVYCDVDARTLLVNVEQAGTRITHRTRAIIVVHLYGNMCDVTAARSLADAHGLILLEDAAQAHGASWHGQRSGPFGHVACYSFYPGKNLGALGDAGAVVSDDAALAQTVRALRDHGRCGAARDVHDLIGSTERMDAIQAAFLYTKLPYLDGWNDRRREIAALYLALLPLDRVKPVAEASGARCVYHQFVVQVGDRDTVRERLRSRGVDARIHYPVPCHRQPASVRLFGPASLPVAEAASSRILSLPCCPSLSDSAVEQVAEAVRDVC